MVVIQLTADNLRTLEGAQTLEEYKGAVAMVLERVEQSKRQGPPAKLSKYRKASVWQDARDVLKRVLGNDLRVPPAPDTEWVNKVYDAVHNGGLDEAYLLKLAQHAKDHMRLPIQMGFLVCQHERCLKGEWDIDKPGGKEVPLVSMWKKHNAMPEE